MRIRSPRPPAIRSHPRSVQSRRLEGALSHLRTDGEPAHSLRTLIAELATLVRNTCRTPGELRTSGNLRYPHHADASAAPRLRASRPNHHVVRNKTPTIHACICHTWNLSRDAGRNFSLATARLSFRTLVRPQLAPSTLDRKMGYSRVYTLWQDPHPICRVVLIRVRVASDHTSL